MKIEEIRELIELVTETGVAELEVQRGGDRVRIVRVAAGGIQHVVVPGVTAPLSASSAHTAPPFAGPGAPPEAVAEVDPSLVAVKSPIVGTFYESPSPASPAFVKVGDKVQVGQVLCIIESMKLMNEIEAEIAGTIVSKLVANAQPIEYGEALFTLRPA
jgi:acetyl-CoA carboxylase biotin carboxyl carrier protein